MNVRVRLINYSQDPEGRNLLEQIAYCARVSNPANQDNTETAEKLVRYLIKNKHWSPLEMVSICLEIETTRDIARQILRHRSFSFQEFSQRYAVADLDYEFKECRLQDTKNRQNSVTLDGSDDHRRLAYQWENMQKNIRMITNDTYQWAIEHGIAKEQARAVLPEGNTVSRLYMNGTLRSWIHFIELRSANGTQKEHREVAAACWSSILDYFPYLKDVIEI